MSGRRHRRRQVFLTLATAALAVAGVLAEAPTTTATTRAKEPTPAHLVATQAVVAGELTIGSTVTYTASIQNTGGTGAAAQADDTLPDSLALIAVDADQGGTCTVEGQHVTCVWTSVNPSTRSMATATVVAQVVAAGSIDNSFAVTTSNPTALFDNGPGPGLVTAGQGVAIRFAASATVLSK